MENERERKQDRTLGNSSEQDLWRTVLLTAVDDALHGGLRGMGAKVKTEEQAAIRRARECQSARDYLTRPSRDLSIVCNLAGLDMQTVIDNMTRQIAAAPSPEELAASPVTRRTLPPKLKPEAKPRAKQYTYNGESLTLKEWSVRTGLAEATLRSRMSEHWPIERALTEPRGHRVKRPRKEQSRPATAGTRAITLTYAGETMTLRQWATRLGIGKGTIDKRLRAGWPIEQVLSPENMRGKSFAGR